MCATFYRHTNSATLHLHPGPTADAVTLPASGQAVTASGLVSPEVVACSAAVRFGDRAVLEDGRGFREYVRVSTVWLEEIVARLESDYALLEQLDVVRNDTAIEIGAETDTPTLSARVAGASPVTGQWAPVLQPPGLPATALTRGLRLLRAVRLPIDQPVEVRALHTDATELGVPAENARAWLLRLVRDRYLVTQLRAPGTVIDPLGYLLDQLDQIHAISIASVAPLVAELREIHTALRHHTTISGTAAATDAETVAAGRVRSLEAIADRLHALSSTARHDHDGSAHEAAPGAAVTVHRRLAASIQLPKTLLSDAEQAATALYRLGRRPADPVWADYHQRFLARYGTGLLVPVTALLHPAAGLGYPAGYPDSQYPPPRTFDAAERRDAALLALAMSTNTEPDVGDEEGARVREVVLDDATIAAITPPNRTDPAAAPPHLDIAVTVHAPTLDAFTSGDYQLHVRAAAPAGTWTAASALDTLDDDIAAATRDGIDAYTDFTQIVRDPVSRALRDAPPDTLDATRVQLSHAPVAPSLPHPEPQRARQPVHRSVRRFGQRPGGGVATCLPVITRLGEYPAWSVPHKIEAEVLELRHIAVFATPDRLHLATLSGTVLDPQLFTDHGTAPPLARFLADLNAGFAPPVTPFAWGPVSDQLPHLPRVRYGRVILSPARWRITTHALHTTASASGADVVDALHAFCRRWDCPATVDLIDPGDEEPRRLTLTDPAHVDLLIRHIEMHGEAIVTETLHSTGTDGGSGDGGLGVLGRAHELVLPMVRRAAPAASPVLPEDPPFSYTGAHGHLPGDIDVDSWTLVKVFTDPSLMSTLITDTLPALSAITAPSRLWFSRHPATSVDLAHLRIHLQAQPGTGPATHEETEEELIEPDVLEEARGLLALVTDWANGLVKAKLTGRVEYATYVPDEGVFGASLVLEDADAVHVADSALATALLTEWSRTATPRTSSGEAERAVVTAVGMVHLVRAFLGYEDLAYRWLATQTPSSGQPPHLDVFPPLTTDARTNPDAGLDSDPTVVARVVALAATDPRNPHPELPPAARQRWTELADTVTVYGRQIPPQLRDRALTALLHAHANRLGALTADSAETQHCLQLARSAAAVLLDDTGTTP